MLNSPYLAKRFFSEHYKAFVSNKLSTMAVLKAMSDCMKAGKVDPKTLGQYRTFKGRCIITEDSFDLLTNFIVVKMGGFFNFTSNSFLFL